LLPLSCKRRDGAAVAGEATVTKSASLTIVTSNFPAYDFARTIAGVYADVKMLLPVGAESHSFEPTPKDIISVQNSSLFIYNGGENEKWVSRILESMDRGGKKNLALMECVTVLEEEIVEGMQDDEAEQDDDDDGAVIEGDEHVWTDPRNVRLIIKKLADALVALDAANANYYTGNMERFDAELAALDAEYRSVCDGATRRVIVFGDRFPFRYLAAAYNLEYYAAFPGCSTETEPSAATVAFLIRKTRAENIPVVFHIEQSNEKIADTIVEATNAKKLMLHSCHNLNSADFYAGLTYMDLMRGNLKNLREALY
jgi:zinc transport system substrate-binding protein